MCSAHKKEKIMEIMQSKNPALQKIPVYYLYVAEKKCIIINKLYFVL